MPVGPEAAARFEDALARRLAGEPVAYIRGIKEFHGLAFAVDARALIPRPETEPLVEAGDRRDDAPAHRAGPAAAPMREPIRVADVGTGSGAIAIALAVELRRRRVTMGRRRAHPRDRPVARRARPRPRERGRRTPSPTP